MGPNGQLEADAETTARHELARTKLRTAIIFISGLLVGVFVTLLALHHRASRLWEGREGIRMGRFLHHLPAALSLDEQQLMTWKSILQKDLRPKLHELKVQHREAMFESVRSGLDQLRPVLNEQQRQRLMDLPVVERRRDSQRM